MATGIVAVPPLVPFKEFPWIGDPDFNLKALEWGVNEPLLAANLHAIAIAARINALSGRASAVEAESASAVAQMVANATPYPTRAAMEAVTPAANAWGVVLADPVSANNGYYIGVAGQWVWAALQPARNRQTQYDVADYGVDNTGRINIRDSMRALLRSVGEAGGGRIVFGPGHYVYTPNAGQSDGPDNYSGGYGLQINWDNIHIEIQAGAVIEWVDSEHYGSRRGAGGTGLFHVGAPIEEIDGLAAMYANTWGFGDYNVWDQEVPGYVAAPLLLISTPAGARQCQLSYIPDEVGPGTWLWLRSNDYVQNANYPHATRRTEMIRVAAVDRVTNTVHLDQNFVDSYTVGSGLWVKVLPIKMVRNIRIEVHGQLLGTPRPADADLPATGTGICGVMLHFCESGFVTGTGQIKSWENAAVRTGPGVMHLVQGVQLEGWDLPDESGSQFNGCYGVSFRGTQFAYALNLFGRNLRHVVDTGIANEMTRSVIYNNIEGHGSHAGTISTHSVVDLVASNVVAKDTAGGLLFRGANVIATNLDIQGHGRATGGTGGLTVGIYQPGEDGKGNPDSVTSNFGNVTLSNVNIAGCADPIQIHGSVENLTLNNFNVEHIPNSQRNSIVVFARRIQTLRINGGVSDCSNQDPARWIGFLEVREWSATLAERGVIDVSDNVIINPSAWVMLINGIHLPDRGKAGDYRLNRNTFVLTGSKPAPSAYVRLNAGFFGTIQSRDNRIAGAGLHPYNNNLFSLSDSVPYSHILGGPPDIVGNVHPRNAMGRVFVKPYGVMPDVTLSLGDRVTEQLPIAGEVYESIVSTPGTIGTLQAVGSIAAGSNTLTLSSITSGTVLPMQWLAVAGAGVNQYVPLNAMVLAINGMVLTLGDTAASSVANATVTYAAPVLSAISTAGLEIASQSAPFGTLLAPRGAICHVTAENQKRLLWISEGWRDASSWRPLHDGDQLLAARLAYARQMVLAIRQEVGGAISGDDVQRVMRWASTLTDFTRARGIEFATSIVRASRLHVHRTDFQDSDWLDFGRASAGYSTGSGLVPAGAPSVRVRDYVSRSNLVQDSLKSRGVEFYGRTQNVMPVWTIGMTPQAVTLVDSSVPDPIGIGETFKWITETGAVATHGISYTFEANPVSDGAWCTFSFFVYCPDLSVFNDRILYAHIRNRNNGYYVGAINLATLSSTDGDNGWLEYEPMGQDIWRVSIRGEMTAGTDAAEVLIRWRLADAGNTSVYAGDGVQRAAICGVMLEPLRQASRWLGPASSWTAPDVLTDSTFSLATSSLGVDLYPLLAGAAYRVLAVGVHEIWCTAYRYHSAEYAAGMYYRNAATGQVINPVADGNWLRLRPGRIVITLDGSTLRIASNGKERITTVLGSGSSVTGLTIGGNNAQAFVAEGITRLPAALSGYDLAAASAVLPP